MPHVLCVIVLQQHPPSLPWLIASPFLHPFPGKEIHFVEFGIGGGTNQAGVGVARTAEQAAYYPFYGIYGAYRWAQAPCRPLVMLRPPARHHSGRSGRHPRLVLLPPLPSRSCQADPFNMCDLATPSPVRDYRRKYFEGISQVTRPAWLGPGPCTEDATRGSHPCIPSPPRSCP